MVESSTIYGEKSNSCEVIKHLLSLEKSRRLEDKTGHLTLCDQINKVVTFLRYIYYSVLKVTAAFSLIFLTNNHQAMLCVQLQRVYMKPISFPIPLQMHR